MYRNCRVDGTLTERPACGARRAASKKFCVGEGDCTSEKARGQSSIFGATDEKWLRIFGCEFLSKGAEQTHA
jgi:hypothetical protein